MTADQWKRVRDLFERALDEPPSTRDAFTAAEAADDVDVAREVRSLLAHDSRAGDFLERPLAAVAPELFGDGATLAPGTVLGQYTIVREIGRGGMGRVYAAKDARLGRTVALKALGVAAAQHRLRLQREARAAAALAHPGICTVYALEEIEGELYIACELVEGRTLREEIGDGPAAPAVVVRTMRELAEALAAAHRRGITHRDLKPENIMRSADGRLKILDFGLAREADEQPAAEATIRMTIPGVVVGTPAYMAPEQLNGEPCDARADVFAFGIVIYEYASGEHPFKAPTELAMLARVLESGARPLSERRPELPPGVSRIIERCLRKQPADRFASAAAIVEAIDRPDAGARLRSTAWWRTHQLAVMALYFVASTVAWAFKEYFPQPAPLWTFLAIGSASAIGGVLRGHVVFTEAMNRPRLALERQRASPAVAAMDLLIALGLAFDALLVASRRPLWAVLTIGLAVGIAIAAIVMEPATTDAAFGDQP
jgi:hypothetical protein